MPYHVVLEIYLKIILPTFQCESFGDSMNLEIKLTSYIMSGLMEVRYMRLPTNLLNRIGSTLGPTSSLVSFVPVAIGVGDGLQFIILNLFNTSMAYLA
jgi:hypothetical protein